MSTRHIYSPTSVKFVTEYKKAATDCITPCISAGVNRSQLCTHRRGKGAGASNAEVAQSLYLSPILTLAARCTLTDAKLAIISIIRLLILIIRPVVKNA